MMHTMFLGLTVTIPWGSTNTLATVATKRIGGSTTTFVAQIAGLFLVATFGLAFVDRLGLLSFWAQVLGESVLIGLSGEATPTCELAVPLTWFAVALAVDCGLALLGKLSNIRRILLPAHPWGGCIGRAGSFPFLQTF